MASEIEKNMMSKEIDYFETQIKYAGVICMNDMHVVHARYIYIYMLYACSQCIKIYQLCSNLYNLLNKTTDKCFIIEDLYFLRGLQDCRLQTVSSHPCYSSLSTVAVPLPVFQC